MNMGGEKLKSLVLLQTVCFSVPLRIKHHHPPTLGELRGTYTHSNVHCTVVRPAVVVLL